MIVEYLVLEENETRSISEGFNAFRESERDAIARILYHPLPSEGWMLVLPEED